MTTAAPFVFALFSPLFAFRGRVPLVLAARVFACAVDNVLAMRDGSAQMAHLMSTELRCEPLR